MTCLCLCSDEVSQPTNAFELHGLKIPIEELNLGTRHEWGPLFGPFTASLFQMLILIQDLFGLAAQPDLQHIQAKILLRAVELAERDFTQIGMQHDEFKELHPERFI